MNFKIKAKGHKNVLSKHKSTFEITKDEDLSLSGDCIIGLGIDKCMLDFPEDFKKKLASDDTKVTLKLKSPNASDIIVGYGHHDLTLDHPTDIICKKSDFNRNRRLSFKAFHARRAFKKPAKNGGTNRQGAQAAFGHFPSQRRAEIYRGPQKEGIPQQSCARL